MSYLEELLPDFRKGAKIRRKDWDEDVFIYFDKDEIYCKDSGAWKDGKIASTKDLVSTFTLHHNDWEFYHEPLDYDYIIKNKCLCSFWDDEDLKCLGLLTRFPQKKDLFPYKTNTYDGSKYFKHCRPVRRDEVTFYGDRNDGFKV